MALHAPQEELHVRVREIPIKAAAAEEDNTAHSCLQWSSGRHHHTKPQRHQSMPLPKAAPLVVVVLLLVLSCRLGTGNEEADGGPGAPTPERWPEQFHARLYTNLSSTGRGRIRVDDLWYDWPNRRNQFVMQRQLEEVLHDVEWDNGTSFYYTLGPRGSCRTMRFPVGVLRPDFLQEGSVYLGRVHTDGGFLCDLWQKLDFIWYYEDVSTRRPVRWDFYDGISMHVMTFDEGAVLADQHWQAPAYCFDGAGDGQGDRKRRSSEGGGEEGEEEARWRAFAELHRWLRLLRRHGDPLDLGGRVM